MYINTTICIYPYTYVQTLGGNIEKELESIESKLYIPIEAGGDKYVNDIYTAIQQSSSSLTSATSEGHNSDPSINDDMINTEGYQRVFIHPSSINYKNNSFKYSSYLLYSEKMITAANQKALDQAKIYIRETTEPTVYSLLLFGGVMEVNYQEQLITIDGWIRLALGQ